MPAKKPTSGLTAEEKAAMKEYMKEKKAAAEKADGEAALRAAIAKMPAPERAMAEKVDKIVKANGPSLVAKTWYGMPAYAKDDEVICFFQNPSKFKVRYATFGFNPAAALDEGNMWPIAYALIGLSAADEAKIAALVKKAVK